VDVKSSAIKGEGAYVLTSSGVLLHLHDMDSRTVDKSVHVQVGVGVGV